MKNFLFIIFIILFATPMFAYETTSVNVNYKATDKLQLSAASLNATDYTITNIAANYDVTPRLNLNFTSSQTNNTLYNSIYSMKLNLGKENYGLSLTGKFENNKSLTSANFENNKWSVYVEYTKTN